MKSILQLGEKPLYKKSRNVALPVNAEIKSLVTDLVEAMRKVGLIGLSAPQLGKNFRIFITEVRQSPYRASSDVDELRVFINPEIISVSKAKSKLYEGCGSVANASLFGPVIRPKKIELEAYDLDGNKFSLKTDGILARVIQHELDHLEGKLFLQAMQDVEELISTEVYQREHRSSAATLAASKIGLKEYKKL